MEYALSRNDEKIMSITISCAVIPIPGMDLQSVNNRLTADHEPLFIKIFRLLIKIVTYEITVRQQKTVSDTCITLLY